MRSFSFLFAIVVLSAGCDPTLRPEEKLQAYFDLDSMLNAQVELLEAPGAHLQKEVVKDGQSETQFFEPDAERWQEEFELFSEFNLNKPHFVGAYAINKTGNTVQYIPVESRDLPIWKFEITYQNGQLKKLESGYVESKYIYSSSRDLTLSFNDGMLKTYQVDGKQNMILMDEVKYRISGTITTE